jgi:Flp pilus assembly protein CpaB
VKAILIIVGGLILLAIGVFASYLLIQRLQVNQLPASASQATVKTSVLVVTRDMFLGDRLAATDLKLVSVPVEIAPRNAITKLEEALNKIIKTDLVQ